MINKKIGTLLKYWTVLAMLITIVGCLWIIPILMDYAIEEYPILQTLHTVGILADFVLCLLCLHGFYHFYKICHNISLSQSFTYDNKKHMLMITYTMLSMILLSIVCFSILGFSHMVSGPLIIWGGLFEFIIFSITLLSYALTQLIGNACAIQEENELTI